MPLHSLFSLSRPPGCPVPVMPRHNILSKVLQAHRISLSLSLSLSPFASAVCLLVSGSPQPASMIGPIFFRRTRALPSLPLFLSVPFHGFWVPGFRRILTASFARNMLLFPCYHLIMRSLHSAELVQPIQSQRFSNQHACLLISRMGLAWFWEFPGLALMSRHYPLCHHRHCFCRCTVS